MLEELRKHNLAQIYSKVRLIPQIQSSELLELSEISKKINYEKLCNQGLFARQRVYPKSIMKMALEELQEI